jgi:hypothetical protein
MKSPDQGASTSVYAATSPDLEGVSGKFFSNSREARTSKASYDQALAEEHQATWPGDRLLGRPGYVWTNAITIQRPAEQVWPWLVQLGQGRGGLYSYDWLENLIGCDIHSAGRIVPQFQQPLQVGDRVIRMARYAPYNPVALFEPARALGLGDVNDSDAALAAGRPASTWRSSSSRSTSTRPGC